MVIQTRLTEEHVERNTGEGDVKVESFAPGILHRSGPKEGS